MNAAYIVGPAIGGILSRVNNRFPLYVAGIGSGVALLVALLYLEESNPRLRHRDNLLSESSRPLSPSSPADSPAEKQKPQITLLLVLCMIFEFCVRWTVNAYDSSYGNYLMHTYGVDSGAYSVLFCIQSIAYTFMKDKYTVIQTQGFQKLLSLHLDFLH